MSQTSDKKSVSLLVDSLLFHGVKHIVVSPGSRNAPLIIGLSASGLFDMISIVDERSAAFFAMGLAQQTRTAVPLICTSGSALLNYTPAIAEAYYQKIPIMVISADRPLEWIDQGDGQTIRQHGVYNNFINYQTTIPYEPNSESELWFVKREIEMTLNQSKKGPVHLNLPFNEPLYGKIEAEELLQKNFVLDQVEKTISAQTAQQLKSIWNESSKKMILVGQMNKNDHLLRELQLYLENAEVVVLDENLSNLNDAKSIHCIDRTLAGIEGKDSSVIQAREAEFTPDILITIGGAIVSKKIKTFLRQHKPKHHWRVGENFEGMDTFQSMTVSIPIQPAAFFKTLSEGINLNPKSNFGFKWKQMDKLMEAKHNAFLLQAAYSDLKVSEVVLDCVPDNSHVHLGNSSIVRYAQLFNPVKHLEYWGNRGTSGIDGSMSTAFGAAYANQNQLHTLILGDLSFFYDSNALWNQLEISNLRIIVLNNGGGGIFKIIPGPDTSKQLDKYFTTQHQFSAEFICKAFNVAYLKINATEEIEENMSEFYAESTNGRPKLMEIFTPYNDNDVVLKNYFNYLKT